MPFLVPSSLSVHISLGACFEPVGLNAPVTHYGFSYQGFLLDRTDHCIAVSKPFRLRALIDPYIRRFVSYIMNILTIDIL